MHSLCCVVQTWSKVYRIWFSVCEGGYREWLYHREQDLPCSSGCSLAGLFPALPLWMEPIEGVMAVPALPGCPEPSLGVRGGCRDDPDGTSRRAKCPFFCGARAHIARGCCPNPSLAQAPGLAAGSHLDQLCIPPSPSARWHPPLLLGGIGAPPCWAGHCPSSGNQMSSCEFRKLWLKAPSQPLCLEIAQNTTAQSSRM